MIKQPGLGRGRGQGPAFEVLGSEGFPRHSGRGVNLSARTGAASCPRSLPGGGALSSL